MADNRLHVKLSDECREILDGLMETLQMPTYTSVIQMALIVTRMAHVDREDSRFLHFMGANGEPWSTLRPLQ